MTPAQLARLFSPDLNLSPEARALVAHVATVGEAEIPYARLLRLLQVSDEKKLRRAIAEAEDAGWLRVERQTGRGHSPRFAFTPPEIGRVTDTMPENGTLKADTLPENGRVNAPLTTTTYNHPTAREALDGNGTAPDPSPALVQLREYLGEHAEAVDGFASSAEHGPTWAAAILGKYGPSGTQRHFWRGVAPEREPAILAEALLNYASDFPGKRYQAPLFESVLRRVRDGAPVKEPRVRPGTEHAQVAASRYAETPGGGRAMHRAGTSTLAGISDVVQANLRKAAREKAGAGAPPEVVEAALAELVEAYHQHHGNGRAIA